MRGKENYPVCESFFLAALLTVVGGFLDAYTYLARGGIFANAQTGNLVLLGLNIAEGKIKEAFFCLFPIGAFIIGIFVAEQIKYSYKEHWRQVILILEIIVLLVIGFIPKGNLNIIVNITISFVCSMQVQSFRKVKGNIFATTMCTGNLRSATEQLYQYKLEKNTEVKNKSLVYYKIVLFFIGGAILGTICTAIFIEKSIWICCFILFITLVSFLFLCNTKSAE